MFARLVHRHRLRAPRRRGLTLLELLIVLVILTALGTMLVPSLSWVGQRSQELSTQENLRRLREVLLNQYMVDMGELPRPRPDIVDGTGSGTQRIDHPQLVYLFVNPDTHDNGNDLDDWQAGGTTVLSGRRWQGPYAQHNGMEYFINTTANFTDRYGWSDTSNPEQRRGDPTITDAWGNPIVIQEPISESGATDGEIAYARRHTRLVSAGRDGILTTPPDELMPTLLQRGDDQIVFLFRHDEHNDQMLDLNPGP